MYCSFLCTGVTSAFCNLSGEIPSENDLLIKLVRGVNIEGFACLNNLNEMPPLPEAFGA